MTKHGTERAHTHSRVLDEEDRSSRLDALNSFTKKASALFSYSNAPAKTDRWQPAPKGTDQGESVLFSLLDQELPKFENDSSKDRSHR